MWGKKVRVVTLNHMPMQACVGKKIFSCTSKKLIYPKPYVVARLRWLKSFNAWEIFLSLLIYPKPHNKFWCYFYWDINLWGDKLVFAIATTWIGRNHDIPTQIYWCIEKNSIGVDAKFWPSKNAPNPHMTPTIEFITWGRKGLQIKHYKKIQIYRQKSYQRYKKSSANCGYIDDVKTCRQ